MDDNAIAAEGIAARLRGAVCIRVARDDETEIWTFSFSGNPAVFQVYCPWRVVAEGRIAIAHGDHGQRFGLPAPVDAGAECARLLSGRPVAAVVVRPDTADLAIIFGGGTRLEAFNDSFGFESWQVDAADGFQVIALGGGEVAIWGAREPPANAVP